MAYPNLHDFPMEREMSEEESAMYDEMAEHYETLQDGQADLIDATLHHYL